MPVCIWVEIKTNCMFNIIRIKVKHQLNIFFAVNLLGFYCHQGDYPVIH